MTKKRILLSLVILLAAMLATAAAFSASSVLPSIFSSAKTLLFETSNVTVTGHAEFTYGGERFKTADILYMQDGTNSHWQLDLLTPRRFRSDRKTGYTIIANGSNIYAMEAYYPGTYSVGTAQPCSSLVRPSTRSGLLLAAGGAAAEVLETMLPADAISVRDTGDGREITVRLTRETTPTLLNSSLNLAADFFLRRFMDINYDLLNSETRGRFEDYQTVTQAILYSTESFSLGDTSLTVLLDGQDRLTAVSGTVTAWLSGNSDSGSPLVITFDLAVSDYGSTFVRAFDPDAFSVVPRNYDAGPEAHLPEEEPPAGLQQRAAELIPAVGCSPSGFSGNPGIRHAKGVWYFVFTDGTRETGLSLGLNDRGDLLTLADQTQQWYMADSKVPSVTELPEEAVSFLSDFFGQAFPDLAGSCVSFIPAIQYDYEGATYLSVRVLDDAGSDTDIYMLIRFSPSLQVVSYTCDQDL